MKARELEGQLAAAEAKAKEAESQVIVVPLLFGALTLLVCPFFLCVCARVCSLMSLMCVLVDRLGLVSAEGRDRSKINAGRACS
jgi:hypothetical protein